MNERINETQIRQAAQGVVDRLMHVAIEGRRTYPAEIEAVLVFSGPGTYFDRLKPSQKRIKDELGNEIDEDTDAKTNPVRWMDRDRIRAGVAVIRDVNARRLTEFYGKWVRTRSVSDGDISANGPFLVYNGIPQENAVFRQVLNKTTTKIPGNKVIVIDEVRRPDRVESIAHTGHQVESFYQEIANPFSPLHNMRNVAVVAHISDFARNVFYLKKYNDERVAMGYEPLNFWVYAIKNRPGSQDVLVKTEIDKVVAYSQKGDIATEPEPFNT